MTLQDLNGFIKDQILELQNGTEKDGKLLDKSIVESKLKIAREINNLAKTSIQISKAELEALKAIDTLSVHTCKKMPSQFSCSDNK